MMRHPHPPFNITDNNKNEQSHLHMVWVVRSLVHSPPPLRTKTLFLVGLTVRIKLMLDYPFRLYQWNSVATTYKCGMTTHPHPYTHTPYTPHKHTSKMECDSYCYVARENREKSAPYGTYCNLSQLVECATFWACITCKRLCHNR